MKRVPVKRLIERPVGPSRAKIFSRFKDFLGISLLLKDNDTYREVVEDLEEILEKGMDVDKAGTDISTTNVDKFRAITRCNNILHMVAMTV